MTLSIRISRETEKILVSYSERTKIPLSTFAKIGIIHWIGFLENAEKDLMSDFGEKIDNLSKIWDKNSRNYIFAILKSSIYGLPTKEKREIIGCLDKAVECLKSKNKITNEESERLSKLAIF
jgi:hypothetical protein